MPRYEALVGRLALVWRRHHEDTMNNISFRNGPAIVIMWLILGLVPNA